MTNSPTTSKSALEHDLSPKSDSTFVVHYFNMHGLGIVIRKLLCLGNVEWRDKLQAYDDTWTPENRAKLPFGLLPVLHETTKDGQTRTLPETSAIERYLSRIFGFQGSDPWEEAQVNVWLSLIDEAGKSWLNTVILEKDEKVRAENSTKWIEGAFTKLVGHLENQLQKNGNCGHLVGNKTTHADVAVAAWFDLWLSMDIAKIVNAKTTPGIILLWRKVNAHPRLALYRESEDYKILDQETQSFFGALIDFDLKRHQFF
ncbi:hypothetical protein BGW42_007121 [Actinomortierella wolfii]|nr:hypothetical protein BGW42_007121 [Actinomortierella wolfii]